MCFTPTTSSVAILQGSNPRLFVHKVLMLSPLPITKCIFPNPSLLNTMSLSQL